MIQLNREAGISQKYDGSLDYGIEMYDNLPYKRNSDVCNEGAVALYSGHIIKYYLCKNEKDAYLIDNKDDEIQLILHRASAETEKLRKESSEPEVIEETDTELTDEQLQALTTEQPSEDPPTDTGSSTPPDVVNLDDIEDW